MRLRTIKNGMNLKGKRVLLRIDANVPIVNGRAVDGTHGKIARAAVGIDWLIQRGARVIVMTHLGEPNGRRSARYSVAPVVKRLSELLKLPIKRSREIVGEKVERQVVKLRDGEILFLENLRFDAREKENSKSFALALSKLGDIYINDAFSVCHRSHVSVDAITEELPSFAGPELAREVTVLSSLFEKPKHPFVVCMGGFKVSSKIEVIENLLKIADKIIIGGALSSVFLRAHGYSIGKSVYDKEGLVIAKKLLKEFNKKILLPQDAIVASGLRSKKRKRIVSVKEIKKNETIVDIGPKSIREIENEIKDARTVVWNGPFGIVETPAFSRGTAQIAKIIAARTGRAVTVVGGGDTVPFVEKIGIADNYSLLSSGGGAMLEFLSGKKLPGIEALKI